MGRHSCPVLVLLTSAFIAACFALEAVPTRNTSHSIHLSNSVAPGSEFAIYLNLIDLKSDTEIKGNKTGACVLDLRITSERWLWYQTNWQIDVGETPKNFSGVLRISTPTEETSIGKRTLNIESHSCFKFSHQVEISVKWKDPLVSIRTDKRKYKPNDDVLIEAHVMSCEYKPYRRSWNITVHDINGIPIVSWTNVSSEDGIVRRKYRIPLIVREEELRISVEIHNKTFNHTVKIEGSSSRYEKNPFTMDVRVPKYHTIHPSEESKSKDLEVKVVASRHCGLPMVGRVHLVVSLENSTKAGRTDPVELISGHRNIPLKVDDIKNFIGLTPKDSLNGRTINIQVSADEVLPSDDKEKVRPQPLEGITKSLSVTFVNQSYVLFFDSSTPLFFKQGLTYIGRVMLKSVDGINNMDSSEKDVIVSVRCFGSDSETPTVKNISLKLPPNSVGEFSLPVPKGTNKIEIEASLEEKESGSTLKARLENILPFSTLNKEGHMIQVTKNHPPNLVYVGEKLDVTITTTLPVTEVHWGLVCQEVLVRAAMIVSSEPTTKHELSLTVSQNSSDVLSFPHLVVGAILPGGEVVLDELRFYVERKPEQKLELTAKPEVVEPGSTVEFTVRGEPYTSFHAIIVSEILAFEPKEQESRKLTARKKMTGYIQNLSHLFKGECRNCTTTPSRAPDSRRVLHESNSIIIIDKDISFDSNKPWPPPITKNGTLDHIEPPSVDSIEEFSSWCWDSKLIIGASGEIRFPVKMPKEARLHTVSIVGTIPEKGLVVSEPVQVTASSKVLASLKHPESIMRGEEMVLGVYLFNTREEEAKVEVVVKEKPEFKVLCLDGEKEKEESILRRPVVLKSKESKVIPVYIRSSKTNQGPLNVDVEILSDDVHHNLSAHVQIKYEAHEVKRSRCEVLDNSDGKQVATLDIPKSIEKSTGNSERALVAVYVEPFGPAIQHVCRRMSSPRILEERTKMPLVLAAAVLEHVVNNPLFSNLHNIKYDEKHFPINISVEDPVDIDKCIRSARDSLEYLINRRNPDGSYTFLSRHPASICLTTTILDIMVQLRNMDLVIPNEVGKTVEWLSSVQKEDGSFEGEKQIVKLRPYLTDEQLTIPRTARVVMSLVNIKRSLSVSNETVSLIDSLVRKSVKYIETNILKDEYREDSYSLSAAAYALVLAKSDRTTEVVRRRDRLVIHDGEKSYLQHRTSPDEKENRAVSVESTSYAILASLAMSDLTGAKPFVNYVMSQMKPGGIFVTSMDTMTALRAISGYYRRRNVHNGHRVNVDVKITLVSKGEISLKIINPLFVGSIHFDHSNISESGPLKIESVGEGLVVVQSTTEHSEVSPPTSESKTFDFNVEVKKKDSYHLEVKVCAKYLLPGIGGAHVGEVPILTGYELNIEKIENKPTHQVLHQNGTAYIVFVELASSTQTCSILELVSIYRVGSIEQKYIKMYPMSETTKSIHKPYKGENSEAGITKICPDCKC